MSLKGIAKETLKIIEEGKFITDTGKVIDFSTEQKLAEDKTKLYKPEEVNGILARRIGTTGKNPIIEVTDETTQVAAHRLVVKEKCMDVVLLNYASARNPGGGFVSGTKAQEEDLARSSGLYSCQLKQFAYYEANRVHESLLYTDHLIYSPAVPWFRTRSRELLDDCFLASVITAPAPNAGQVLRRNENAWPEIEGTLRRRAGCVLAAAEDNGHRTLLLGAWGCGVFRNRAKMVADAFGQWLESERFLGCFDRVNFGVYDPSKNQETLKAFQSRFC